MNQDTYDPTSSGVGPTGPNAGPLLLACQRGDTQCISELLNSGYKLEAQDARAIGNFCNIDFLRDVATDMFNEYFRGACSGGKTDSANYLLDKAGTTSTSVESIASVTAFMSCCYNGMNSIIERIAHLFLPGSLSSNVSPVIAAGVNGHIETVKLLIGMGYNHSLGVYQEIINQEIRDYINSLPK